MVGLSGGQKLDAEVERLLAGSLMGFTRDSQGRITAVKGLSVPGTAVARNPSSEARESRAVTRNRVTPQPRAVS